MSPETGPVNPTAVVIDDDPDTAALITGLLRDCGFTVHTAGTGESGVAAARDHTPVLVTMDLGLPGIDGFETTRQIRQFSDAYILVISGSDAEEDLLMAFGAGADDYLTKPFRPRILQARVQTVQRRPLRPPTHGQDPSRPVLENDGLVMDPWARTVQADGQDVTLTRTEFDLLRLLLEGGRRLRTRAQLALLLGAHRDVAGDLASSIDESSIDVYVSNLRRKLRGGRRNRQWIQTLRGTGYRLATP
jgi:DNA-binding response OmpR family regulator